jgi:hypothetical protein
MHYPFYQPPCGLCGKRGKRGRFRPIVDRSSRFYFHWTVSVHDERGSLVETLPFPANTARRYALHYEEGIAQWAPHSPPQPHQTGSTRYH